jgi:hypothetical protein
VRSARVEYRWAPARAQSVNWLREVMNSTQSRRRQSCKAGRTRVFRLLRTCVHQETCTSHRPWHRGTPATGSRKAGHATRERSSGSSRVCLPTAFDLPSSRTRAQVVRQQAGSWVQYPCTYVRGVCACVCVGGGHKMQNVDHIQFLSCPAHDTRTPKWLPS